MISMLKKCLPFTKTSKTTVLKVDEQPAPKELDFHAVQKSQRALKAENKVENKVKKLCLTSNASYTATTSFLPSNPVRKRGFYDTRKEYLVHNAQKLAKKSQLTEDEMNHLEQLIENFLSEFFQEALWKPHGNINYKPWSSTVEVDVDNLSLCPTFIFTSRLLPLFHAVKDCRNNSGDKKSFYEEKEYFPQFEHGVEDLDALEAEGLKLLEEGMEVGYQSIESLEVEAMQYLKGTELIRPIPKTSAPAQIECSLLDDEEDRLSKNKEEGKRKAEEKALWMLLEKKWQRWEDNEREYEELFGKEEVSKRIVENKQADTAQSFRQETILEYQIVDYKENIELLSMEKLIDENFYGGCG
eukprot:snap_masked-scaffold_8-processed-gene-14.21-mRNA-1 protein AED:1.00 eAED:1.00 QI:0/-1/0/0/-1/1/1/0/355